VNFQLRAVSLEATDSADNLFQSPFWGRFKARFDWTPCAFRYRFSLGSGCLLVLIREIGADRHAAYVPYGPDLPLAPAEQGLFLEALSRRLEPRLPEGCVFVRYDLPWDSPYSAEYVPGELATVDPRPPARIREIRMNFGTSDWNLRKSTTDLLPTDTGVVDLDADDDLLLARMTSTARYNIRMSLRRGVTVEEAAATDLPTWYRLYAETTRRQGIQRHPLSYFRTLFEVARESPRSQTTLRLLIARVGDSPAAGMILALHRRRAIYLFGASANRDRRLAPSHRLQWRAIKLARSCGCTSYDLFGVPPSTNPSHPMHGLYRFKTGFGGRLVRRRGCWDYPFDKAAYTQLRGLELSRESFHRSAAQLSAPG
jgi:lipid II:glycine glycyltransferase (peptidoglycan interpeptide bridge formation enzyme)